MRLFDKYLFADYSGASRSSAQRKAIKVGHGVNQPVKSGFTRLDLLDYVLNELEQSTSRGERVIFGFDHSYGLPIGLAIDLGIESRLWRETLKTFVNGEYGSNAPVFQDDVPDFAKSLNDFLITRNKGPYFWSATKRVLYSLPGADPRGQETSETRYRLTEKTIAGHNPKPICRLGDPGTVGGQSLYGMLGLHLLLNECVQRDIPVRAWPFDGLNIADAAYHGAHVLVEPYPTALRPSHVPQSDENDAYWTAHAFEERDMAGGLAQSLNLEEWHHSSETIRFEGWIFR